MGGIGSGTWYRWNKTETTEEVNRIDIRYMKRKGLLRSYSEGLLQWSVHGEKSGSVRFKCFPDRLELAYRYRLYGGDWQPVTQAIYFDKTPCNYGGERTWLLCPRCKKRVAVLYGAAALFLCRQCYQLPYRSQRESHIDRIVRKKNKLGQKIFEHYDHGEGWGKKKGMHKLKFYRLYRKYLGLEREWNSKINRFLAYLTR